MEGRFVDGRKAGFLFISKQFTHSSTQEVRKHDEEEFLAEGRRAMACKEYEKATLAFQEACELM